ncbi:NAD-dependent succinate-semialdehyde dehydrogenase [Polynucleobacter paneuropaeus]|nr:NAD-dependent succinate-semialdehyde dehydrogenase [Polynucleobacter paneuropaeus]
MSNIGLYENLGCFIDGKWISGIKSGVKEVFSPATGKLLGVIPDVDEDKLQNALESARTGFFIWKNYSPWDRSKILRRAADLIRERNSEYARVMSTETGKPIIQAEGEWRDAADQFEWYSEETKRIYGQTIESRSPDIRMAVHYEPVGVVAAFSAWNFPALLPSRKIAAALGAGCSVVIKPASEAPGSAMLIVQALLDAGLPAEAVNLVTGDSRKISRYLINSPIIKKVTLTGSTNVGREILHLAADGVKKVSMELGGHAPVIVFEDADIDEAAEMCARFKFRNCGQVCASPSRFYVHSRHYEKFCEIFARFARSLIVGNGLDSNVSMGPMINARGLRHVNGLIDDALSKGATMIAGNNLPPGLEGGNYISPTVLSNVPDLARVMFEEPFGPIAPIASFSDFDDVIARANSTPYGLASYIFTKSLKTASYASEQIEAGMVGVNEIAIASAEMPFGGVKQSGIGREGGAFGILDYLEPKFIKTKLV